MAAEYVEQWLNTCDAFKRWHRENLLLREPTAAALKESERVLPWLIRFSRLMHGQMLDPTWPHPQLARPVAATLRQLEELWELTHNPIPEAEADALLAKYFPDAPGA
jgi:hypothetical protein